MNIEGIIFIKGKSGLYKIMQQNKSNVIVQNLVDGKKVPIFKFDKISSLDGISVFLQGDEVLLKDVLLKIWKHQEKSPVEPLASKEQIEHLFSEILPDYDKNRVYLNDIKKMFQWYNILLENGFFNTTEKQADK